MVLWAGHCWSWRPARLQDFCSSSWVGHFAVTELPSALKEKLMMFNFLSELSQASLWLNVLCMYVLSSIIKAQNCENGNKEALQKHVFEMGELIGLLGGSLFTTAGRWQLVPSAAWETPISTTESPWSRSCSTTPQQGSASRSKSRIVLVHTHKLSHPERAGCEVFSLFGNLVLGKY